MDKKTYEIGGREFTLKEFGDYTHNEEVKIKSLLGITENSNAININTKDNNDVFPLLLTPVDDKAKPVDFNDCKNNLVYEIITDWIAARIFFTQNMGNSFAKLLNKKIQPILNTPPSTDQQDASLPS